MKYKIIIGLLIILFISGCTQQIICNKPYISIGADCCLDQNDDSICDSDEDEIEEETVEQINKEEEIIEDKRNLDDYDIDKLEEDVRVSIRNYLLKQDQNDPTYYNGNGQKFFVVKIPKSKITDVKSFYNQFSAEKWEGYKHFVNATELGWLQPLLTEEKFDNEKEYRDYVQGRDLVEIEIIEKTYDLEEGKVLEYQFLPWIYDQFGTFQGAWVDTLLIYKIYCSPNLIVFLRPDWEKLSLMVAGQNSEGIHANWESSINQIRPELLKNANIILKNCPVDKEFFREMPDKEFKSSETLAYNYKMDLKYYWNLETEISTIVEPSNDEEGKYLLKELNVTFTNNEGFILWGPLLLDIEAIADGEKEYEITSERKMGEKLLNKKSVSRSFSPSKEPVFSDNLKINIDMYIEEDHLSVRPKTIIIGKDNKIVEMK